MKNLEKVEKAQKMIFVLKPDFTYEIKHYMEDMMTDNPQEKKKVDVLNFIRKNEKPVCVADIANDPIGMGLSSGIRKRTLRYIFEFLEKNKLIQRVDTPVKCKFQRWQTSCILCRSYSW